ncbi:hypothetical protein AO366_1721 [Moraxella catarrhalis]|uniref:Uncharacterized protein n=1 Tax=Moraxella canis TaxID=90239 RepID=A0A1S9ZQF7_9GAMM|nr:MULTISPECIES: hypothetical protein [Moraxella]OAV16024.1 hypothetical protein AO376_0359 [Moraxella catarrhalis]OAV17019.1 hypothetical protein AO374_1554 [Moraxella catarrhalis]OAV30857.1 hypothetical protein AO366_1721 [Moraxella catarrhalis]OOR85547.1 hypothetical protein B0180_01800 [Moraxella canis]WQE03445.1 hypothetical protein U0021_06740 [Moraxella canis]
MLAQLQALEQTIIAMKKQYAVTATELANLKQRIANDDSAKQIETLQDKLNQALIDIENYNDRVDDLQQTQNALEQQVDELYQANQALITQNQDLKDKNALAISRAEVIRDWLSKIDRSN